VRAQYINACRKKKKYKHGCYRIGGNRLPLWLRPCDHPDQLTLFEDF